MAFPEPRNQSDNHSVVAVGVQILQQVRQPQTQASAQLLLVLVLVRNAHEASRKLRFVRSARQVIFIVHINIEFDRHISVKLDVFDHQNLFLVLLFLLAPRLLRPRQRSLHHRIQDQRKIGFRSQLGIGGVGYA